MYRDEIIRYCDEHAAVYQDIARQIHSKPEVSNYEFFASGLLSSRLEEDGFRVVRDVAGHRTGFTAEAVSGKPGPVLVFLAEYDALTGLGHGCGHNLFGAASSLAAAALKQVLPSVGGTVRVYGTPGEEGGENGSAKGSFVREGYLKDVDAALCVHPGSGKHVDTAAFIACAPVDIEFFGKSAHAAAAPEKGINALEALIQTFNGIDALRLYLTKDVNIHGIVVSGGDAPNTIPDYAKGKFYLRAATSPRLRKVYARVEEIVKGAALMTGARGEMRLYQNWVDDMMPTPSFDKVFREVMESLGEKVFPVGKSGFGSSDVGNISLVVPTIQPTLSISAELIPAHTEAFRDAACSPEGMKFVPLAAKAMALTALRLLTEPATLEGIRAEHRALLKLREDG